MFFFNKLLDGRVESLLNMEKSGSNPQGSEKEKLILEKEKLLQKVKKNNRRASPRLCCWISVFSILFIVLACPGLDPLEGKYETLRYAASFERDSLDICKGRRVYMYDLPPEFNIAVNDEKRCNRSLMSWIDLCPRFTNDGYGVKLWNDSVTVQDDFDVVNWYDSDSYMLEKIFHIRLQKYRCLTKDPFLADAFFVPFYTGLVALDLLYDQTDPSLTFEARKNFGKEVLDWLVQNGGEHWSRFGGRDHFIIMGRTTWDFYVHDFWGTGYSELPYASNMTSLLLERRPGKTNEVGIPYPTAFHPDSPQSLQSWIDKVENSKRKYLFSYVGAPRPDTTSMRGLIGSACINAGESVCHLVNCSVVKCSHDPVSIYRSFLQATFCLQPKGDTATRRSTFDCLISGAIPIFFDNDTAYTQYLWHLPQDPKSYSVFISEEDIKGGVSIKDVLMSYSAEKIREMQRTIISIIPNLLYNAYETDAPSLSKDAYEISLQRVLEKITATRKELASTHKCWLPWLPFRKNCYVE